MSAADELLRLNTARHLGTSTPLDGVISRSLEAEVSAAAEAAGGSVAYALGGGWSISVTTPEEMARREAARARPARRRRRR